MSRNCGSVKPVAPIVRIIKALGLGVRAVPESVSGAVFGNQVKFGNRRTVATILGAIDGGFAGNAIEKDFKKKTVY